MKGKNTAFDRVVFVGEMQLPSVKDLSLNLPWTIPDSEYEEAVVGAERVAAELTSADGEASIRTLVARWEAYNHYDAWVCGESGCCGPHHLVLRLWRSVAELRNLQEGLREYDGQDPRSNEWKGRAAAAVKIVEDALRDPDVKNVMAAHATNDYFEFREVLEIHPDAMSGGGREWIKLPWYMDEKQLGQPRKWRFEHLLGGEYEPKVADQLRSGWTTVEELEQLLVKHGLPAAPNE